MLFDDPVFEWWAFLNGRDGIKSKTVCRIPDDIGRFLKTQSPLVYIGFDYAQKSAHKHRLEPEHFVMIQAAIQRGAAYLENENVIFFYEDSEYYRTNFYVVVKSTANRKELWIKTFHRKRTKDLIRSLRGTKLIRNHC